MPRAARAPVPDPARWAGVIALFSLAAAGALLVSLCAGSLDIAPRDVAAALLHGGGDTASRVVLDLRLPRVLSGFVVGALLALSGALMQVLLRNALAEPFVLGISGGASVAALAALSAGLGAAWVHAGALCGALLSMLIVFALPRAGGEWNPMRILLTGVVIASGWGAAISLMLSVAPAAQLHTMLYWLMGDLSQAQWSPAYLWLLLVALAVSLAFARALNLLARGELQAAALGVPALPVRCGVYVLASLTAAAAVMQAGSVGFVGLIVPHAVRLLAGADHRVVLPSAALAGGTLLVLADALARTVIAPQQLPVGVLTAALGVPVFLVLLQSAAARQRP